MPRQPTQPFGRIRLTQVVESWSAEHALNPRMLAGELADALRTIGPDSQALGHTVVSVSLYDPATGPGAISIGALANYFERYCAGVPTDIVETTNGNTLAGAVMLSQSWITRLTLEAEARAELAAGYQQAALTPVTTSSAQPIEQHQPPPSGSDPECLALRQKQQRQEGEQSASEQLDAERLARQKAEAEVSVLRVQLASAKTHNQQLQEDAEHHCRTASKDRRLRTLAEEQLREHAGIIAFMDISNPLSPIEGRRAVTAWSELTGNGTKDPVIETGIGVGTLIERWWRDKAGEPSNATKKRLQWFLTWPSRKKGGVVSKAPKENR